MSNTESIGKTKAPRQISGTVTPVTIRLPRVGTLCPWTGLSRSALNELILPTPLNNDNPPVESTRLQKRPGARSGTRLIYFDSLMSYLESKRPAPAGSKATVRRNGMNRKVGAS